MTESVLPKLREKFQTDVIMHRTFLVQHYPESILAEKLEPWETALPESIKLAYLPNLESSAAANRTGTEQDRSGKRTERRAG